jgi:N-acetyl-anhydromuramyl-L-alanine amidase AmpD
LDSNNLLGLTKELIKLNNEAYSYFINNTKQHDYVMDFYGVVKPFVDKAHDIADQWKDPATEWILENKPKYVYPIQIKDTHENITISAVLAFQLETRDNNFKQNRFLEMIQSIEYVLESLEQSIKNTLT